MSDAIESLPEELRPLFIEIVGIRDGTLLSSLKGHDTPSQEERIAVERILSDEFSRNLTVEYEPTEHGKAIDQLLGAFLLRWPIEGGQ